jgi:hypothetical protein
MARNSELFHNANYYSDDPDGFNDQPQKKKLLAILAFLLLLVGGSYLVKTTLAANISINSGPVEFGQGNTQTVACSGATNLTITPNSTFANASGGGAHYFSSVKVSNIPIGCYGNDFTIRAYGNSSSIPLALFNTSSASAVVYNDNGTFKLGIGSTGSSITSSAGTFTFTFTSPVALASTVMKVTVESGKHIEFFGVGDTGPGGGTIFYYSAAGFNCGSGFSATGSPTGGKCNYLEAAPSGWNSGSDPTNRWAQQTPVNYSMTTVASPDTATATAIGRGYRNTRAIVAQGNTNTANSVAPLADSYTVTVSGVAYDDWYLPSKDELNQMCKWARNQAWVSDATICNSTGSLNSGPGASGFVITQYWSSSEYVSTMALAQGFGDGTQASSYKYNYLSIRPIRAF